MAVPHKAKTIFLNAVEMASPVERRAYVTADQIWVEPVPEDATYRVFELNFKRAGCDSPAPPS